jgi:ribosomal protein S18 acetylase RimI-like enzyme
MKIEFTKITQKKDFPGWLTEEMVISFFHETMKPYEDKPRDIKSALNYMYSDVEDKGGFLMAMLVENALGGALLMLNTGMSGYVPENILLFVTVDPELRGKGMGRKLIERSIAECKGEVKLHVEYDNPAKRLYERIGFTSKYAEMRYSK